VGGNSVATAYYGLTTFGLSWCPYTPLPLGARPIAVKPLSSTYEHSIKCWTHVATASETDIRKERQREGIDKAKALGKYAGRKPSVDKAMVLELKAQGVSPSAIAKQLKIGRASVYRAMAQ